MLRDREVQRVVDELLGTDDRSLALDDHTIASRRRAAATTRPTTEPAGDGGRRAARVRRDRDRAAEPAVHDRCARRRRARDRQPHGRPGAVARGVDRRPARRRASRARRGRRTDADRARQGVQGTRARSPVRRTEKTADVLQRQLKDAHRASSRRTWRARWPSTSATTRAGFPSSSSCLHSTYGDDATLDRRRGRAVPRRASAPRAGSISRTRSTAATSRRARGAAPAAHCDERRAAEAAASDAGHGVARLPLPAAAAARRSLDRHQGTGGRCARDEERGRRSVPARSVANGSAPTACAMRCGCWRRPSSTFGARAGSTSER